VNGNIFENGAGRANQTRTADLPVRADFDGRYAHRRPLTADIIAKVENRTASKISRKLKHKGN
jgi:hypothetical protein